MKETQKALGVVIRCYCGSEVFTLHSIGKEGYMVRCVECRKRFILDDDNKPIGN